MVHDKGRMHEILPVCHTCHLFLEFIGDCYQDCLCVHYADPAVPDPLCHFFCIDDGGFLVSAILGISVYYALENVALAKTSASDASLIEAAFPALTALVGLVVYRERPSKRMLAGIAASIIGVAILTQFDPAQSSSLLGDFLLLFDGCLWGFYNYETKSISHKYDSFTLTMYQCAIGTVFFVPMLALEKPVLTNITPAFILTLVYLSTACSLGALLLYNYGLKGMKASTAAVIMNLMPIFGVLLSWGILHETITRRKLIGGAIILLGVWISTTRDKTA